MQVNVTGFQIKELIASAKKPLVVLGGNADVDLGSLAVAWVEIFESYEKKTILVKQSELPQALQTFVKSEQQKDKVEPKSLVLSLDWAKNKLDKVSYDLEGDKFNLIITSHGKKIDPSEITYSYRGQDFDLIVLIGVEKLDDLLALGIDSDSFESVPSVLFAKTSETSSFAKLNLVAPNAESLSAKLAKVMQESGLSLPTRAAESLLFGIRTATDNFANVSDPETFEAAAFCKRSMIPGMINAPKAAEKPVKKEVNEEKTAENWLSPKVFRSGRIS